MITFFSSSRTILLMSEESLHIYELQGSSARLIESVPWVTESFGPYVARILMEDCRGRPVLLLNDMMEQNYRRESIIQASALDISSIIERKIKITFPNHAMCGSMLLKEKPISTFGPNQQKKPDQHLYIFAAIPESEPLVKTLNAVRLSYVQVIGCGLLPVESAGLVSTLADQLSEKNKSLNEKWTVLITQHRDGGLRQIVIKGSDLALTRMTPLSTDPNVNPQNWATEVTREFKATMDYISRFGYKEKDPIQIIVIAPIAANTLVENEIGSRYIYTGITLDDALRLMDWTVPNIAHRGSFGGLKDTEADILHVIWSGRKRSLSMPMRMKMLQNIAQPRFLCFLMSLSLIFIFIGQFIQSSINYKELLTLQSEVEKFQTQKDQLDIQYKAEVKRRESFGFDIILLQSALDIYKNINLSKFDIDLFFKNISNALGRDMNINSIYIERQISDNSTLFSINSLDSDHSKKSPVHADSSFPISPYEITLNLVFAAGSNPDQGNTVVSALRDRIQVLLPDYKVTVTKFLKDYGFDKEIVIQSQEEDTIDEKQNFLAVIKIVGSKK